MIQYSDPLDAPFKALADPTRRAMLAALSAGEASVSDLAAPFDMTLTAARAHVRILEDAGLIATAKIGRTRVCRIDMLALHRAEAWLAERRTMWERRLDRLGAHLAANKMQKRETKE